MGQRIKSDQYFSALRASRGNPTAALVLEDGSVFTGCGFGAATTTTGEVCFNTSMTGYQEILSDPSYAGQIITFTFPHIGNVGVNDQDFETDKPAALGLIVRQPLTNPASWRATSDLDFWLKSHNLPGISGIDTRALVRRIRDLGAPRGTLCHASEGSINLGALRKKAAGWPGLVNMDLAREVSCDTAYEWRQGSWQMNQSTHRKTASEYHVIAVDFGCKHNILRCLEDAGCAVHVVPSKTTADEILALKPDGVFLSNGPGDPSATAAYAGPQIAKLIDHNIPTFGICIGHQLMALALGAKTHKMDHGHRGANHPVKDLETGKIEITSQNHGFVVEQDSLPDSLRVSHISLFDQSIEGLRHASKPAFCVQYHPESSPGPHDSRYLFARFTDLMKKTKA
ncbi:MAG: glutamine-hydrolyzing carbamoyl-phosphate synthase small subunit [Candidatus Puniceispirillaceae bacterium]